jgi:acetyl esterase/lipase
VGVTVDYRLAPEHPFPIPFDDCYESLKWALENASQLGASPSKVIIAGASAGGNLSAAISLKAKEQMLQGIIGQILIIPATCHYAHYPPKYELESCNAFSGTPLLNKEMMIHMWGKSAAIFYWS